MDEKEKWLQDHPNATPEMYDNWMNEQADMTRNSSVWKQLMRLLGFEGDKSIADIWKQYTGETTNDKTLEANMQMQEDAQDFAHQERLEQNDWELALHRMQLLDDPQLQFAGLSAAGFSPQAAAQAILGSQGSFGVGAASNGSAPMGSVGLNPPSSGILDTVLKAVKLGPEIANINKDTEKKKTDILFDKKQMEEANQRIKKLQNDLNLDNKYYDLAASINERQLDLYDSEIAVNYAKWENLQIEWNNLVTQGDVLKSNKKFLDAQAARDWAQSAYLKKQTEYIGAELNAGKPEADVISTIAGAYESQSQGSLNAQNAKASEMENIVIHLRSEVAKLFKIDPDSDTTTQVLECLANGSAQDLTRLLKATIAVDTYNIGREMVKNYYGGLGKTFSQPLKVLGQ